MQIGGFEMMVFGKTLKFLRLIDERYMDVEDPAGLIEKAKNTKHNADILTFIQRLPDSKPKYDYYVEYETCAALPIVSYEHWLQNQIPKQTRTSIKKSKKEKVIVKKVDFNDDFIHGMVSIFNECPIRQGKPFWHYGKDFETVKKEFSKYLFREEHVAAFHNDEMIGFLFLAYADRYAISIQIISKIAHQDKKPTNALLAKAVEICAEKNIPYLVYGRWARGDWGAFKRHNGFENIILPRYFVPLTLKGKLALSLKLHHGISNILPENLILRLMSLRKRYYSFRHRDMITDSDFS